jgi:hypothetical protein
VIIEGDAMTPDPWALPHVSPYTIPFALYYVVVGIATTGWLALFLFPRRPWANFWYAGVIVPLILSLFFGYFNLSFWHVYPPLQPTAYFSLEGVHGLFQNPGLLAVGWTDLLFVDLILGAWMTRRAAQARIPYIYLLPCLLLTFTFAGFGFLLFAVICGVGGRWSAIARFEGIPDTTSQPVSALPIAANTR